MNVLAAFVLLATVQSERTAWMRPDAFHLSIGMSRVAAVAALHAWNPKRGANDDEVVVDYAEDKALTLQFHASRLQSVRFELYVLLPAAREAFDEERARLLAARGAPSRSGASVLVYDGAVPNVMVVVADDPKSEQGKKGVGVLAVRYFDPR